MIRRLWPGIIEVLHKGVKEMSAKEDLSGLRLGPNGGGDSSEDGLRRTGVLPESDEVHYRVDVRNEYSFQRPEKLSGT